MEKTKESALQWVKDGKLCIYRYGFAWKGAEASVITNDEAMRRLQTEQDWDFGIGFYELIWTMHNGEQCLLFNEFSENDLY